LHIQAGYATLCLDHEQEMKEAMLDWQERIAIDPDILVGKPIVRGTRLAVEFIIDLLAQGWTEAEILRNYPGLTHEDVQAFRPFCSPCRPSSRPTT
jgi:uncharacterized protein (DUF433 family)